MVRLGLVSCALFFGSVVAEEEASSLLSVKQTVTKHRQPGGGYGYSPYPPAYAPEPEYHEPEPIKEPEPITAAQVIVDSFETRDSLPRDGGNAPWVQEVEFREPMAETPVVVGFMSGNGGHPAQIRIFDVTTTGFKAAVAEPPSCKDCHGGDGPHMSETVNYIAAVPGETAMGDIQIEAGLVDVKETVGAPLFGDKVTGSGKNINFESKFGAKPAFLSALQTSNSFDFVGKPVAVTPFLTAGVLKVSAKGAEVALERAEVNKGKAKKETVGWIAISSGKGNVETENGEIQYKITNAMLGKKRLGWQDAADDCKICEKGKIGFGNAASDDVITVASQSSRRGNNGGWLRTINSNAKKITIVVDEDTFNDNDREHVPEEVSSAMFSGAFAYHARSDA